MKSKLFKIIILCLLASITLFAVSCKKNKDESQSQSIGHGESQSAPVQSEKESVVESDKQSDKESEQEFTFESESAKEVVDSFVKFSTLTVKDMFVYGKVANSVGEFSFEKEISVMGDAKYIVAIDQYGLQTSHTKVVPLSTGDNIFYIFVRVDDEIVETYTVTIRRRPIHTVTFNTNGGTEAASQQIEEDSCATEPTTQRVGYDFVAWDYDFTSPITQSVTVNASWSAHTNTKYTVEYYLQKSEGDNYTLDHADELEGTTDTTAIAEIKTFEHFTYNEDISVISGNINGDGSLVLKIYYAYQHSYGNGVCTVCGKRQPSKGLRFILNTDGESYSVTGLGECTDLDIVIPEIYNNLPVTTIGSYAFACCKSLTSVVIGDSVTIIYYNAFYECSNLTNVVIGDSVTTILDNAFYRCISLTNVVIGDSVTAIGDYAFAYCKSLTSVEISDRVTAIGDRAFFSCSSLSSVVISKSVITIGEAAFFYCNSLAKINYRGTEEQWEAINKGEYWDCYGNDYKQIDYTITYNYQGE